METVILVLLQVTPQTSCSTPASELIESSRSPQELRRLARSGDKRAQLQLGLRAEASGRVAFARKLYRRAAKSSEIRRYVYSSPVAGQPGRVMQVGQSKMVPGLKLAQDRLRCFQVKG